MNKELIVLKCQVKAVCPICGREYSGRPALSRTDNKTDICPDCGVVEALMSAGIISEEVHNSIINAIHKHVAAN